MLGHWFERGLGQIVAPDPIHEASIHGTTRSNNGESGETEEEEEEKGLLDILAPEDPNYKRLRRSLENKDKNVEIQQQQQQQQRSSRRPQSPPTTVMRTKMEEDGIMVRCVHCHKLTPTTAGLSSPTPQKKTTISDQSNDIATPTTATTTSIPQPQSKIEKSRSESDDMIIAITPSRRARPSQPLPLDPNTTTTNTNTKLQNQILSAAKGTAATLSSPTPTWENIKNIFVLCTCNTNMTSKKLKKLSKSLLKNPEYVECRSVGMGHLIPDGFTPLHAASHAGNVQAVQLLIDLNHNEEQEIVVDFDVRDMQGRTSLHIAAEKGHVEIVSLLKAAMTTSSSSSSLNNDAASMVEPVGKDAPVDLTGRTPLAYAATSKDAFKHRSEIEHLLFSPGDESVCGVTTPAVDRGGGGGQYATSLGDIHEMEEELQQTQKKKLEFGFAEMPGYRIEMEDALCCHYPLVTTSSSSSSQKYNLGLFGVFDGHGDGGLVSQYLANNLASVITSTQEYKSYSGGGVDGLARMLLKSCPVLDGKIKEQAFDRGDGGSTAVMALVSEEAIVAGNVGDSRCILVQYGCCGGDIITGEEEEGKKSGVNEDDVQALVDNVGNLALTEEEKGTNEEDKKVDEEEKNKKEHESKKDENVIKITELSEDHKPNLPNERARIERSGMLVMPEVFRDDAQSMKSSSNNKDNGNEKEEEEEEGYTTIWKIQKSDTEKIAVSRAFGDFDYKSNEDLKESEQAIVCTPDIRIHVRDGSKDAFLVMACDGIWDVMSSEEVGKFVWDKTRELLKFGDDVGVAEDDNKMEVTEDNEEEEGIDAGRIKTPALRGSAEDLPSSTTPSLVLPIVGDKLIEECLRRGSRDNMSVLIISLSFGVVTAGMASSSTRTNSGGVKRAIDFAEE